MRTLLPSGEGGDERGGLEDPARGDGVSRGGVREVVAGWRGCEVDSGWRGGVKGSLNYM